jgi:hypothetical protein
MTDTDAAALSPLKPYAVPIKKAQELLGGKARSEVYKAVGDGELDAVKDGAKTLITVASIERRQANLPAAVIKPSSAKVSRKRRLAE